MTDEVKQQLKRDRTPITFDESTLIYHKNGTSKNSTMIKKLIMFEIFVVLYL